MKLSTMKVCITNFAIFSFTLFNAGDIVLIMFINFIYTDVLLSYKPDYPYAW